MARTSKQIEADINSLLNSDEQTGVRVNPVTITTKSGGHLQVYVYTHRVADYDIRQCVLQIWQPTFLAYAEPAKKLLNVVLSTLGFAQTIRERNETWYVYDGETLTPFENGMTIRPY